MQSVPLFRIINPTTLNPEWIGETAPKHSLEKQASASLELGHLVVWKEISQSSVDPCCCMGLCKCLGPCVGYQTCQPWHSWIYLSSIPNGKRGHLIQARGGVWSSSWPSGSQSQILAIPSMFLCLMSSHWGKIYSKYALLRKSLPSLFPPPKRER